ncbi:MAG: SDR family NAD(P)-dependent oxidoreductase [Bacteroidales bacterium]|nr:SDR family NAD(P)-dependent oxidoreductase [Bacteroidales bacterium]
MHNTEQKLNTQYTIILGAEGELGRAMAREIARKACNLILVSTTSVDLQRFAIGLQLKEDVQVNAIKLDLSDKQAIQKFTETIRDRYEVRALINNITCDWSVAYNKCILELAREDFLTRFRGAALITWGLLPHMSRLSSSFIQHIIPFPFKKDQFSSDMQQSVSKMYVFAKELEEELKHTAVSVSLVHPAPIKHMMPELELTDGISGEINTLTPGLIALKAVNGMLRGDRLIIPGFWNRVQFFLNRQATAWFRSTEKDFGSTMQPSV